tara:strand:+ start:1046 stop:2227 length:1182 start_codon:yes stop_codon:yes gene_type:complete
MKTKICVIGAGTAGIVSVLSVLNSAKRNKVDVQVTCMYDPSVPTVQVGESTSSPILNLLTDLIGFRVLKDLESIDGTLKYGSKYVNWSDKDFFVHHQQPAIHLNSAKFSFWVLEKLLEKFPNTFTSVHDNVLSLDTVDDQAVIKGNNATYAYDYVIDCRGFPSKEQLKSDTYKEPTFTSVNSVIIYPEFEKYDEMYTTAQAHKNGWMFQIPLTFRKAFGYLYNNNITSEQQATDDFLKIKPNVDITKTRKLSWTSFYRTTAVDGRILYSGNKLFFFEPSQGFPLHYYAVFADYFVYCISTKCNISEEVNYYYQDVLSDIQDVIAMTYQADVEFDSKFWRYANQQSYKRLNSSKKFLDWCNDYNSKTHFASHSNEIMFSLIEGMNIDLTKFRNT